MKRDFEQLELIAKQLFRRHYDHQKPDPENCGACALVMDWKFDGNEGGRSAGPNYAGWARVYVEARKPIPQKWKQAFEAERKSDNKAYAAALEEVIAHFGVRFEGEDK